jgi:hypothetical protein
MSHRIRRVQQLHVAPAPLVGRFGLFAERLEVRTNDRRILAAAEASFGRFEVPSSGEPLVVRFVDDPVARRRTCGTARRPEPAPRDRRPPLRSPRLAGRAVDLATGFGTGASPRRWPIRQACCGTRSSSDALAC